MNTFTEHHGGAWSPKDMQHTYVRLLTYMNEHFLIFALLNAVLIMRTSIRILIARSYSNPNRPSYSNPNRTLSSLPNRTAHATLQPNRTLQPHSALGTGTAAC